MKLTGHEVPLSVALDQNNQWHAPGLINRTQQHQSEGLLILVAITSTCCTMQVGQGLVPTVSGDVFIDMIVTLAES